MKRSSVAAVLSTVTAVGLFLAGCSTAEDDYSYDSSSSSGSASTSDSSSGGSSSGSSKDPLSYPQVEYKYTCSATGKTNSIQVSTGPCASQQRAYARTVGCNEVDSDGTFNSVGRPFYQCLVNNTSDPDQKKYYQQYLDFYSR